MCIDYGPDYRVISYGEARVIVLLAGGDKRTQDADIERAIAIAKEWSDSMTEKFSRYDTADYLKTDENTEVN